MVPFLRILFVVLALAARPAIAAARGVIAPDLVKKLSTVFPVGTKPDQVRALCGEPELIKEFDKNIVVWRYVTGDQYFLFAFHDGLLTTTSLVSQKAKQVAAVEKTDFASHVQSPINDRPTQGRLSWSGFYSERGVAAGATDGNLAKRCF